jgi:hypothetical protein
MSETEITPVFNPADYPRRYSYETPLHAWAAGYFVVVVASFISAYALAYNSLQQALPEYYIAFSIIGFLTAIFLGILMVHRVEVEMDADEIRVTKLFKQRALKRHDIKGWHYRRRWGEDNHFITLVPLRSANKAISIKDDDLENLKADDAFHAWYKSLTDLGKPERDEYYNAIYECINLGATKEVRLKRYRMMMRGAAWLSYAFIAVFVYLYAAPNAYLPSLTFSAFLMCIFLTMVSIIIIYRYPVLLRDPPVGIKGGMPFYIVDAWGFLFSYWLLRDTFLKQTYPDIENFQINLFYMVAIFLFLSAPLLADRMWRQMPLRFLRTSFIAAYATCGLYLYGNMALDQAKPHISHEEYVTNYFGDADSTTWFSFDRSEEDMVAMGCAYRHPGAFGTAWLRYGPCPENFQKSENAK